MKHALSLGMLLALTAAAPAQDYVKERLNKSPRHHEWVKVKHGNRVVECFMVYPEVKDKATAIIVIHENKGLQDWVRGMADQLAEAGYIAIAPDLLSGMGPGGTSTKDLKSPDEATMILGKLKPEQVTADLNAVADYIVKVPGYRHRVARLFFRDSQRNYLQLLPLVDVDLSTGEVRFEPAAGGHDKK